MSEFEDKLNSLLSDPAQMSRLAQMAKSIVGETPPAGAGQGAGEAAPETENPGPAPGGFDPEMLASIGRMFGRAQGDTAGNKGLLEAMKPYLAEKRRKKIDRAMRLAHMATLAKIALKEYGGGEDGL